MLATYGLQRQRRTLPWYADSSSRNNTVTVNGNATQSDLGTGIKVATFDGSTGYLTASAPDSGFDLSSGSSTIEFWFKPTTAEYRNILYAASALAFHMYTDGRLYINNTISLDVDIAVILNAWQHVAVVFYGGFKYVYLNGIFVSKTSQFFNATNSLNISYNPSVPNFYDGSLAGIRIVKGFAVYTSNFTVPTIPLTAISGTQLLMNFGASAVPTV